MFEKCFQATLLIFQESDGTLEKNYKSPWWLLREKVLNVFKTK